MAIEITIPRLGWNMEEGTFAGWLKRDGDLVHAGEAIFSLESDKATQDIECLDNGVLRISPTGPRDGEVLPVGKVIAYLAQPGEASPFERKEPAVAAPGSVPKQEEHAVRPSSQVDAATRTQTLHEKTRTPISPRARRVASQLGVDWSNLSGTGRTGRIREQDVRMAAERGVSVTQPPAGINRIRRTIAERMLQSHQATAPVTLTTTADAGNLVSLYKQLKTAGAASPTYTDIVVKLCALALGEHPGMNARWEDEQVVRVADIHIGIAVDTAAGLYVPVLRDALNTGLRELATRAQDLIERARSRKLKAEEMQGGTFTVTNLGAFDIDAFTPIINYPECAILGIGRIRRVPVVRDEQIEIGDQVTLSLTFDHRIVDGAPAARFLQALSRMIQDPATFLPV